MTFPKGDIFFNTPREKVSILNLILILIEVGDLLLFFLHGHSLTEQCN